MRHQTLFHFLMGIPPEAKTLRCSLPLTPETPASSFLEKGHVMEYILIGPDKKKMVTLFFGPNEFVVKTHREASNIVALDEVVEVPFTYGMVFNSVRKFEQCVTYYRTLRQRYLDK